MSRVLNEVGKIGPDTFRRTIFPRLGAVRKDVLVGPRHGIDAGIVDLGSGRVMALATDPLFIVPEYGWERAGWFAVHIVVSDVATSGLIPSHLTVDLNLPLSMTDAELAALWESVHLACEQIGVAIVTGHTGRYDNCSFPMVGAATAIALGEAGAYVTPAMAQTGDVVLVTKGPAIETTALLGLAAPRAIEVARGNATARAAEDLFWNMSVVRDAALAAQVGVRDRGVTAMHDATERGVLGGLVEMAQASGNGIFIDLDDMPPRLEVEAVCSLFDIDPYASSSSGTLILTCRPSWADAVVDRLAGEGIDVFAVGEMVPAAQGMWVVRDGSRRPLEAPAVDPFWPAYRRALEDEAQ